MSKQDKDNKSLRTSSEGRWYLLRVTNKASKEASLCFFGALSPKEKSFSDIVLEGNKALRSGYHRILFPWNFLFHSEKEKIIQWFSVRPHLAVLSIHKKSFPLFKRAMRNYPLKSFFFNVVLEDYDSEFLDEIEKTLGNFQITISAHRAVDIKQISESVSKRYNGERNSKTDFVNKQTLQKKWFLFFWRFFLKRGQQKIVIKNLLYRSCLKFPEVRHSRESGNLCAITGKLKQDRFKPYICFQFPFFHKDHPQLYSSEAVYHFLKRCFYPPSQTDIYNLSIPEDLKLEPERVPEWSYCFSKKAPRASIVIPSYNSAQELALTLEHLFRQDLKKSEWEVIVVDDGSEDQTDQVLQNLEFLSQINFKYVFLPREHQREGFADYRFRAGIARNLGVKQAQGKFLFFLDSDILTSPSYLSSVCRHLEKADVVQHPRYHLIKSAPRAYDQIDKKKHTFIKGDPYWENFYASADNWNQKKLPWKYISTNTLCLKSSVFKEVGWFRKNYTSYGFEDTDLGYRLFQAGYRFKLNPLDTYHLYRPSEFLNSMELKQKLLGFSAKLFFHNTHCLEAYEEFSHLINQSRQ